MLCITLRKQRFGSLVAASAVLVWVLDRRRRRQQRDENIKDSSSDCNAMRNYLWWEAPPATCIQSIRLPSLSLSPCQCESTTISASTNWPSPPAGWTADTRLRFTKRITNATSEGSLNVMYQVHWDKPLGQGGFGDVYFATDQATGERVACKQISKEYTDDVAFRREMEAFLHLKEHGGHPNICTLRETFDEGSNYYLIFDLISGGEMFDHLINNGAYSEADAARLMREVASALAFLHGIGCVHGDLKPENLMLSTEHASDAVVKVIDFGCAQVDGRDDIPMTTVKTVAYCPPEVLAREAEKARQNKSLRVKQSTTSIHRMDPSLDMWSLGVILYIMLTGYHPFDLRGDTPDAVIARRVVNRAPFPVGCDSPYTAHLSQSAIDLIQKLLTWDPDDRLTALEMLDHSWVRGETARKDKIADSDKKLSKIRGYKSSLEAKVFSDLFTWSEESAESATKKTSLIERSFRSFDAQQKGFVTSKDLQRRLKGEDATDDNEEEALTLSNFEDLLSENMKNKYFQKDYVVYREGEEGNEMFFINSGVVEISTKDGFVLQLKQGDFVGEGALLSPDKTRSATVKCVTPVHVIEITREYFEKYLSASRTDVNLKMRELNKKRVLNRTQAILRHQNELKPIEFSRGDTLYNVGDDGTAIFILEKGKVQVRAREGTTVFTVNRGDLFGERASFWDRPRGTSAVCASEKCKLHMMDASAFHRVLQESPALKTALHNVSLRREFQQAVVFRTKRPFPTTPDALREVFDLIDEDKSGKLSFDQIRTMLKRMDPLVPEEEIQGVMNSLCIDIDETNDVNFEEFKLIFGLDDAHLKQGYRG